MQHFILIRTMQNLKLTRPTTNTGTQKSRNKSYYKLADSSFFRRKKKNHWKLSLFYQKIIKNLRRKKLSLIYIIYYTPK